MCITLCISHVYPTMVSKPAIKVQAFLLKILGLELYYESELKVRVIRLCLTLCDYECSLPCFSVLGILQSRILGWVAIPFSRGTSWPRARTWCPTLQAWFFTIWAGHQGNPLFSQLPTWIPKLPGRHFRMWMDAKLLTFIGDISYLILLWSHSNFVCFCTWLVKTFKLIFIFQIYFIVSISFIEN